MSSSEAKLVQDIIGKLQQRGLSITQFIPFSQDYNSLSLVEIQDFFREILGDYHIKQK